MITKRKPKYITIAEFCRVNQLNKDTVRKAIKEARITSVKCNKVGRVVGMQNDKCLAEYKANTDRSQAIKTKIPKAVELEGEVIDYMAERAKREQYMAKTAELEYMEKAAMLVPVADVRREVNEIFTRLKNNIFGIALKKSQSLAVETDALRVERLLRMELTEVFDETSNELSESIAAGAEASTSISR
jgi:hypothetical protein